MRGAYRCTQPVVSHRDHPQCRVAGGAYCRGAGEGDWQGGSSEGGGERTSEAQQRGGRTGMSALVPDVIDVVLELVLA